MPCKTSIQKEICFFLVTRRNESGIALILALMVMVLVSLLVTSSFELLTANIQITGNHKRGIRAIYVADAGIEDAINQLRANPASPPGSIAGTITDSNGNIYNYSANITGTDPVVITATGTAGNIQRIIEAKVRVVGSVSAIIVTSWILKEI